MVAGMAPEQKQRIARRTPLGRLARVDEVANAVHFLTSDEASFITGQPWWWMEALHADCADAYADRIHRAWQSGALGGSVGQVGCLSGADKLSATLGLSSLDLAFLVAELEAELGVDPFANVESPECSSTSTS